MTKSVSRRVDSAPTMLASAPSPKWECPRITPGCSTNVRFTASSNARIRTIWVYIHRSRALPFCALRGRDFLAVLRDISGLPIASFFPFCVLRSRFRNLAQGFSDRDRGSFPGEDPVQHAAERRFQLVADFFGLQFDQRLAGLHPIPFALQPAYDNGFGAGHSAGFGYNHGGHDAASVRIFRSRFSVSHPASPLMHLPFGIFPIRGTQFLSIYLAGGGLGNLGAKLHRFRSFNAPQLALAMRNDGALAQRYARTKHHERLDRFSPMVMRNAQDRT